MSNKMINILQIAPKVPYPLYDGGALGVFNITKNLALRGHNITFITYSNKGNVETNELVKYCNLVTIKKDTSNKLFGALLGLFSDIPYTHNKYLTKELYEEIDKQFKNTSFDIAHIDHLHMSKYGKYIKDKYNIPVVLREHNYETLIWDRLYKNENNPLKKFFYKNQLNKIEKYEPQECKVFDKCLMVTDADLKNLFTKDKSIKMEVVPAGVDIKYFQECNKVDIEKESILFVGSLDWFPNIDAFRWFYYKIFPLVKEKHPNTKLYVIGKNPPEEIKNINDKSIFVLGMVEDVRSYFAKANVCIVPLRIGGGMRIKILEMMAMKKAIVSTSIGAEGIDVIDGKELIIRNSESDIANAISQIFNDDTFASNLGENGYYLVNQKYSWEKIAEQLEKIYIKLINDGKNKKN